jgi:hypothetical protein
MVRAKSELCLSEFWGYIMVKLTPMAKNMAITAFLRRKINEIIGEKSNE